MEDPLPKIQDHLAGTADPSEMKTRRPRVKQVSSRFMSPFVSSAHRRSQGRNHDAAEPLACSDRNRLELTSRADSPFPVLATAKPEPSAQRRHVALKLFKENGHVPSDPILEPHMPPENQKAPILKLPGRCRPRIDAPIAGCRMNSAIQSIPASLKRSGEPSEEERGESEESTADNFSESETSSVSSQPGLCDSPPIPAQKTRAATPDVRSSMPETERFPARYAGDGGHVSGDHSRVSASPFYRSLNSALSLSLSKSVNRSAVFLSSSGKPATVVKVGSLPPPHPAQMKAGIAEARKGRCSSGHAEDVHALKLLYNRHLQWRYANAKAVACSVTQENAAEKLLYNAMEKVANKSEIVVEKRQQLARLKIEQTLSTLLEAQMPFLDEWSSLEEDFSGSLAETSIALVNATTLLPTSGVKKVNINDLDDVFNSMSSMMETISSSLEHFTSKASGLNNVSTDVAGVVTKERALIEESKILLSKAHMLQVEECSLRSQLIQWRKYW